MRLILEFISGPLAGKNVVAEPNTTVRVGRTTKADFATEDGFMSGEHFAVENKGSSWTIRDLKSRNGTRVNGKRIDSAVIQEGDRVHAGSTDFIVHLENQVRLPSPPIDRRLLATLPPAVPPAKTPEREWTEEVPPAKKKEMTRTPPREAPQVQTTPRANATPELQEPPVKPRAKTKPESQTDKRIETLPLAKETPQPVPQPDPKPVPKPTARPPKPVVELSPMDSYIAVTPGGRLRQFLLNRDEPLFALIDATQDKAVLEMLKQAGEPYSSLYRDSQNDPIAPYLIAFSPESELLREMIQKGWGHSWGLYLTCQLPLPALRDYYRKELMVSLPDGVELFSRFYDPRYFRVFLDNCSPAEAEKFFGPVTSYFMEAEKAEIVLEFTRTEGVVEKQGHLLTDLE